MVRLNVAALNHTTQSTRKNLADDVLNRHFLNVNVAHGKLIEQSFAGGNDAVALDLELDAAGRFFHDFAEFTEAFGGAGVGTVIEW